MKTVKTSAWTISFIGLFIMTAISDVYAQQGEKDAIFNKWYLDSYVVEGKKHTPSHKEKEDYILFREDMTFVSKTEGKKKKKALIF